VSGGFLQLLDFISVVACLCALVVASVQDLRSRLVDDRIWFACLAVVVPVEVIRVVVCGGLCLHLAAIGCGLAIALALKLSGVMGEADCIAIVVCALALPVYGRGPVLGFMGVDVFLNSILLSVFSVFYFLGRSLVAYLRGGLPRGVEASLPVKALLPLVAYPEKLSVLLSKSSVLAPVEEFAVDGGVRRRVRLSLRVDVFDGGWREVAEEVYSITGDVYVWCTIGLPHIVFILGGFLAALTVGNIIFKLVFMILT